MNKDHKKRHVKIVIIVLLFLKYCLLINKQYKIYYSCLPSGWESRDNCVANFALVVEFILEQMYYELLYDTCSLSQIIFKNCRHLNTWKPSGAAIIVSSLGAQWCPRKHD